MKIPANKKKWITILLTFYSLLLCWGTACRSTMVYGAYCDRRSKLFDFALTLDSNSKFVHQTNDNNHQKLIFIEKGNYSIENDKLTLYTLARITYEQGVKTDSQFLPKPDTIRGIIKKNKIILFAKMTTLEQESLKKCYHSPHK